MSFQTGGADKYIYIYKRDKKNWVGSRVKSGHLNEDSSPSSYLVRVEECLSGGTDLTSLTDGFKKSQIYRKSSQSSTGIY